MVKLVSSQAKENRDIVETALLIYQRKAGLEAFM